MAEALDDRVVLRVGEKQFFTTKTTLAESRLFTALWIAQPCPTGGEYFIDNDPELFGHILRYLRNRMFPLFYDSNKGHDMHLYTELLQQAKFYQIAALESWLSNKGFLKAVSVRAHYVTKRYFGSSDHIFEWKDLPNVQIISKVEGPEKAWKCNAQRLHHDGDRNLCIMAHCGGAYSQVKTVTVEALVREVRINRGALVVISPEAELPPPY